MRGDSAVPLQPTTSGSCVCGLQGGSSPVCELWRGLCGVSSLPFTAMAGMDIAATGIKLALAHESTSVSSNGPMGVG